ncbi:MAG: U32 family peptidase [Ruminococcaceae bacterium]|nr:U32 family peptidase [Oscillospiraceae bacterium]
MEKIKLPNAVAEDIRARRRLPELLSPAGSYEALTAAIEGGADAVYIGGVAFNARINAKNFTYEEMKKGIALAHSYGAKVYIAANTLVYDRELDEFLRAAEDAYKGGADALIIADVGAAREVAKRIPIELHASTQMSGHGLESARVLADVGFSRMVCAREMSKEDIAAFTRTSPIEAEVFVHGALCVCHSGQCLFSSLVGGRSGNRGECAQPCRLPYEKNGKNGKNGKSYPLSLKDLCLAEHIPELCDMGVASLKIEGRMKSPEYVRDVTSAWRRLLDLRCAASKEDVRQLAEVFSRDGFTDGYFNRKISNGMLGIRTDEQKSRTRELEPFSGLTRNIRLDMSVSVRADAPATLTVTRTDNGKSATAVGDVAQPAKTAPIDENTVRKSLSKLGDTPYRLGNMTIELDEGLMLPISALNALRRSALAALDGQSERAGIVQAEKSHPTERRTPMRTAVFYEPDEIPRSAYEFFDVIFTPIEKYMGNTSGVLLPAVIFDGEKEKVKELLGNAKKMGAEHALVGNVGHISLVREAGMKLHGDFRLNATNDSTVAFYENLGFEDVILSPELTLPQLRDIGGKSFATVYGRMPLMVTEKCVNSALGDCKTCVEKAGRAWLVDRKGVRFPVFKTFGHRSIIFNSAPFYMADKQSDLDRAKITMQHFIFTVENKTEAESVISSYKKHQKPSDNLKIKRIK